MYLPSYQSLRTSMRLQSNYAAFKFKFCLGVLTNRRTSNSQRRAIYSALIFASLTLLIIAIKFDRSTYRLGRPTTGLNATIDNFFGFADRFDLRRGVFWQKVPEPKEMLPQELFGIVWPRSDNDTTDRIRSQIDYMHTYSQWKLQRGGSQKRKMILVLGYHNLLHVREGQAQFAKCPVSNCEFTRDMDAEKTADAVLMSQFTDKVKVIGPKPAHQIWIAHHSESPRGNRIDTRAVQGLINWTATYRRDSTIPLPYGYYEKIKDSSPDTTTNYAANKTKKVAMLVSNCDHTWNTRLEYARALGQHIQVDIYGKCGSLQCPAHTKAYTYNQKPLCHQWLGERYKFYLAFENSNCKDYITEKFMKTTLNTTLLPIVMGASRDDYAAVAPPHSYLHVDDFESPLHLALFLHELDKNDELYSSYFVWKRTTRMVNTKYFCRMCMMLHLQEDVGYVHWYDDYDSWWNNVCRLRPQIYSIRSVVVNDD